MYRIMVILCGIGLIFLCQCGFAADTLTKVSVELKWFHQFQFAGIYAAKEKGFYKKAGLDVTILARDVKSTPLQDVLSGKVAFGVSDASIVKDRLQGKKVIILAAIFQHSPLVLITLEKNKILGPGDLRHKRIMYQKNVDDAILKGMFNEFNLSDKDYIFVPHNFKDDALIEDDYAVDAMSAYLSNQPYYYAKKGMKLSIINPQNYGVDFYGDIIFTSESYFKKHQAVALAFRRATIQGWQYALRHKKEVINWILKKYKGKKDRGALEYEADVIEKMILPEYIELGHVNKDRLSNIAFHYKRGDANLKSGNIEGLYYLDQMQSNATIYRYLVAGIVVIFGLALIVLVMLFFNRKLKKEVMKQIRRIKRANQKTVEYFSIIDQYVLMLYVDKQGVISQGSSAFAVTFDIFQSNLVHKNIFNDTHFVFQNENKKQIYQKKLSEQAAFVGELMFVNDSHQHYALEFTASIGENSSDQVILIFTDVSDKKRIEKISITDGLTQLNNRYKLSLELELFLSKAERYQEVFSVIMMDLDNFKKINDAYGHEIGDDVLVAFSRTVEQQLRRSDIFGRWGGEEFLVMCPCTRSQDAVNIAEKMRASLSANPILLEYNMTASFGVAEWQLSDTEKSILKRADQALYEAKAQGRNRVIFKRGGG